MGKKQSLAAGITLGPFKIIRLIGVGGMGEVYEAYERNLDRRVALKIISPDLTKAHGRYEMVERFKKEARTLAKINHPNVVTIYVIDRIEKIEFISMEYIEGVSLKSLFKKHKLTAEEAVAVFIPLLEGLKALHESSILHRDIKPHNLMLRADGQIKILDFGIAKRFDDASEDTNSGVIVGSVPYMPPEVRLGKPASIQSDLWSVGAILYEALVGEPLIKTMPRLGKEAEDDKTGEVVFSVESTKSIPEHMRVIVRRLCARREADRFATADDTIAELKRFRDSQESLPIRAMSSLTKKIEDLLPKKTSEEPVVEGLRPATQIIGRDSLPPQGLPRSGRRTQKIKPQTSFMANYGLLLAGIGILATSLWLFSQVKGLLPTKSPAPVVSVPLQLESPRSGQTLWLEANQIVTLSWNTVLNAGDYDLQIARDRIFSEIVISEHVSGKFFRPDRVLEEGEYFWRLVSRKSGALLGPQSFVMSYTTAPQVIRPGHQQVMELAESARTLAVDFSWRCKAGAERYKLQIARNSSFTENPREFFVSECELKDVQLAASNYYWRLRVEEPSASHRVWTEPHLFSIRARASKEIDFETLEPVLERTELNLTLNFKSGSEEILNAPYLSWRSVPGARSYVVQLSELTDFSHLLSEEKTAQTQIHWRKPRPGRAYWRVYALDGKGKKSNFSRQGRMLINLPAPFLRSEYKVSGDSKSFTLGWNSVPLAGQYVVQWSDDPGFREPIQKLVRKNEMRMSRLADQFFVRVAAASSAGQPSGDFSTIAKIKWESRKNPVAPQEPVVRLPTTVALGVPELSTPPPGKELANPGQRISIIFSWTEVPDAIGYTLEVALDQRFTSVVQRKVTQDNKWILKKSDLNGQIFWRVRSEGPNGQSSPWSEVSFFQIR